MPSRFRPLGLGFLCAAVALAGVHSARAEELETAGHRLREGTLITNQLGTFKIRGDRATFYPEGSQRGYGGLENLNLARVYQTISETPDDLLWTVSGVITEYNGANYLLVTRAVRKTSKFTPPPITPAQRDLTQAGE